jgi:L-rhamnose mutarotase
MPIRRAFRMSVHPGCQAEYERRHSPVWPELEDVLKSHGVREYSIFLDPTSCNLFAYVEIESQERWDAIAGTEVCRRWWQSMSELMPSAPDHSPLTTPLREVFRL